MTGYKIKEWEDRYRHRTDISSYLVHLTKGKFDNRGKRLKSAQRVLQEILESKTLKGSTTKSGYINGPNSAVCFQDMPLSGVCQNTLFEQLRNQEEAQRRYVPIGIAFPKHYVYQKGGRPVLYEKKEIAKKILPQEEWWRIVNFDLDDEENIIDWTHEREWRTKGDFEFDLKEATILLVNHNAYESFMNSTKEDILKQLGGVVVLRSVLY
ncbi:DUF2971 domain-containing protein [Bacillus thuringiensis]|uniref:DUF2971 domain-containing protein n=1 Tax=Bacillus thuringiensis TaxID=1428 RepID=A0AB36TNQ8_BACTU|nr:DUF2971 domain-containing protein [Bacillus thuringiensis]PEE85236.1 DUF2971 domain-containing protein [Bacillus thuringiensis]PFM85930.1 DUF2971 domain-containing protein [Bacillus thuringiensis]